MKHDFIPLVMRTNDTHLVREKNTLDVTKILKKYKSKLFHFILQTKL